MSKKTIYRSFPDKYSLLTAMVDLRFEAMGRRLAAAAQDTQGKPFAEQMQGFLLAAAVVLSSLYPVVPVVLGVTALRETLRRSQLAGLIAALAATVLIAAA